MQESGSKPMSGVMNSLRSGADRAVFEAGKLVRLQRLQTEQRAREQERRRRLEQLGEAVWQLYAQGRISDPELVGICHQVQTITAQIVELNKAIATLRQEQATQAMKCLDCGHDVAPTDAFCPFCGAKTAGGDAQPAQPPAAPPVLTCAGCGRTLRPGASFCSHCGRRQGDPS